MQGYDADNPNIELLRLRNFTIGKKISDEEVISPNGLDTIVDLMCAMTPFVSSTPQSRCVLRCLASSRWLKTQPPTSPHNPCSEFRFLLHRPDTSDEWRWLCMPRLHQAVISGMVTD
jgi:hypothetical protein